MRAVQIDRLPGDDFEEVSAESITGKRRHFDRLRRCGRRTAKQANRKRQRTVDTGFHDASGL